MDTVPGVTRADLAWRRLAQEGARRTLARGLVIDVLAESPSHLSVSVIHQRLAATRPEINVSTVHRTVTFLTERGVTHLLQWPGEALYGLNESPHVHAVCDNCGTHTEVPAGELDAAIAAARRSRPDLDLGAAGIALFGRCKNCSQPSRSA